MIHYHLIGVDGSRFDLSDPSSPVRLVTDPDGMDGPPRKAAMQENVNQGGAFYKGQQDAPNPIEFKYRFGSGMGFTTAELMDAANRWRRALGTGRELAEFHVVDDDLGTDRWQWVRNLDRHAGPSRARLMAAQYVGNGECTLTSDSSYWEGVPVDETLVSLTGNRITNAGDFDGWPQYQIEGPTTGLKIGLDGEQVALANIPAGSAYTIDTNPTCPLIHKNGVDDWPAAAGRQSFRTPAPPGVEVPITITGSAASVRIVLPQQYWAAIG